MKNKIIAILLSAVFIWTFTVPTFASSGQQYLSEVALVYEDSVEDAKKAIEGTDWKLFEKDLNPDADYWFDDGVYLIYKTTTDPEKAITDLRVMDMYGGYSVSNYESQLKKSRTEYMDIVNKLKVVAAEFKTLYMAGDPMAKLAYRQMNFYKDAKTDIMSPESDMFMGDFFLKIPSDEALVRVLMEGNASIISNLIKLLTIGLSGNNDTSLQEKVEVAYAAKDTLTAAACHDGAVILEEQFKTLAAKIKKHDTLVEQYNLDDKAIDEDELLFIYEYVSVVDSVTAIKLGDTNLCDMLRKDDWDLTDLYPIVASLTPAQMALISMGQFETVIRYNLPTKSIDELNAAVDEAEAEIRNENGKIEPVSVYLGVDREIFKGSFAMTTEAERQQALTGKTWDMDAAMEYSTYLYKLSGIIFLVDFVVWMGYAYVSASALASGEVVTLSIIESVIDATGNVTWAWNPSAILYWLGWGIALVCVGLSGIGVWYNYYNPDYLDIPNVIIDVRETDLGDRYIKYSAAKVFGDENKNADFNAYEGKEWIALYYTTDASAGNCLTPNFVYSENSSSVARRHAGVSMFGESTAFNLNSHVYDGDAPAVYLSVRTSTTQKAAANVGNVIGSIFGVGGYALAAGLGLGTGMLIMALFNEVKRKRVPAEAE